MKDAANEEGLENGEPGRQDARPRPAGFRDVAERAGVSITTVERVLNERGSVSNTTRKKVLQAAGELRLRRVLPDPGIGNLRIEAILPANPTEYWAKLSGALRQAAGLLPRGVTLHRTFVAENNPTAMASAIVKSSIRRAGLIVAAEVNPAIETSLAEVVRRGEILVSVSTMISGLPRHAFSGIDNKAAGRTAATLINVALRKQGGHVLVLQGNATLQSHRDRVAGFREHLAGSMTVELTVTHEVPDASRHTLAAMLAEGRIPQAIYETGDPGDAIAPLLRSLPHRPIWIGHERNPAHDALMREGLLDFVLDQDLEAQARWAVDHILSGLGIASSKLAGARRPELRLFCAANLTE